jgi:hypothetical protein
MSNEDGPVENPPAEMVASLIDQGNDDRQQQIAAYEAEQGFHQIS